MRAEADHQPMIAFVEVPDFYAAVERAADPALRERPVIVGGDPRKRGKVQSASSEARSAGVVEGMLVLEALERCPRARAIKTDMPRYRDVSIALRACLRTFLEAIEPEALGSAYLDLRVVAEPPEALASRLLETVTRELGLPLRMGIAPGKLVARLAAEEAGPRGWRRVGPADVSEFLAPLALARLPRVGPKTVSALQELGAHTIGELVRLPPARVEAALGSRGLEILELARGEDRTPVRLERHARSMSRECSFDEGETDEAVLVASLADLAGVLEAQLERQGLEARRVAVKVRSLDQVTTTRSCTLEQAVSTRAEIYDQAAALLARSQTRGRTVRCLGITLAGLSFVGSRESQLDLFSSRD